MSAAREVKARSARRRANTIAADPRRGNWHEVYKEAV
jgi:hypothetical protein